MTATVPTGNTYDKYGSRNPIERAMVSRFMRVVEGVLPAKAPSIIVEVGAGEGHVSKLMRRRFPHATIVALDLPDGALTRTWHGLSGVFGSADQLPFRDGAADLVLAIEVLEHVEHPEAAMAEISRIARGVVIASVPREPLWRGLNVARGKYVKAMGNTPGHIQHWGRRGFVGLVSRHLDVTCARSPLPWTVVAGRART